MRVWVGVEPRIMEGWSTAGGPVDGPGATVQLVRDGDEATHLALQFPPELASHPLLHRGMEPIAAFVRDPGVEGVAPLVAWDRERATFVYPAGDGILLASVLDRCGELRRPAGLRAALELVQAVGPVLDDAARAGRRAGLPAHGALNPWRILVHPMGGATVLGHGVPAVEIVGWLESPGGTGPGAGLRYFAPERLAEQDEDLRGDLYALAVSAAEVALGGALLAGEGSALAPTIRNGGAVTALRAGLVDADPRVLELFTRALAVNPTDRPASGRAMAKDATALLKGLGGASLYDLAADLGPAVAVAVPVVPAHVVPAHVVPVAEPAPAPAPVVKSPVVKSPVVSAPAPRDPFRKAPATSPDEADDWSDEFPDEPTVVDVRTPLLPSDDPAPEENEWDDDIVTAVVALPALPPRAPRSTAPVRPSNAANPSEPVAAVDDLPPTAPLAAIQAKAREIVARTAEVASRTLALAAQVTERIERDRVTRREPEHDTIARTARLASDRAERAASSARSAAGLIELDEDATGALITLDLVRNAELQCDGGFADATAQLAELDRLAERALAQARALGEAARKAEDHAARATEAANQADDVVTTLEGDQRSGALTAEGTGAAVDLASTAAERAHAAAEEARGHAEQASRAERADIASRHAEAARRAEEAAFSGLEETRLAADRARHAELEGHALAIERATERSVAAAEAANLARAARQRAEDAIALAPTPDGQVLRAELLAHVSQAESLSTEAATLARDASAAADARGAQATVREIEERLATARAAASAASTLSDRIVALAGARAEARARVSKLQDEVRGLQERAQLQLAKVADEAERLLEELGALADPGVVEARGTLRQAIDEARRAAAALAGPAERASATGDVAALEPVVTEARSLATAVGRSIEAVREATAEARSRAEDELTDLRRRDEARRAVADAAGEARKHAAACRARVDEAWTVARGLSVALRDTELEVAIRCRTKALEIIDIAEFQSGEAASSAELAATERDPGEARAHAQTAQSFLERITSDLPEALDLLAEAERHANEEVVALTTARTRTQEVAAQIEQWLVEARAAFTTVRDEAAPWHTDDAVVSQLGLLDQSCRSFGEDLTEAGWARDRAAAARTSVEAAEVVPNAESAHARAKEKRRRFDVAADAVRRAVAAAEAAAAAVQDAREVTRAAGDAVSADLDRLIAADRRLATAITTHAARDEVAANAALHLRELEVDARRAQSELVGLIDEAQLNGTAETARRLAARATELRRAVERMVERAAESEALGTSAAENEARSRALAHQQRVTDLRQRAWDHGARAKAVVDQLDTALGDAGRQVSTHRSALAVQRFEQAVQLVEAARGQVADVDAAAEHAGAASDVSVIEGLVERARALADRVLSDAARAQQVVEEAVDLARAAAQEAEALASVRDEVAALVARAEEAVERARAEAARIPSVVRDSPVDAKPLVDEAGQHVQAATKAAAKVRAVVPLAAQADTLLVAQSILRTARLALERANAEADGVRQILDRAADRVREERESASRAVAEARSRAAAPGHEAVAAARKADAWLDAGRREADVHRGDAGTGEAHRALDAAVTEVRARAEEVARAVAAVESADPAEIVTLEAALRRVVEPCRAATDQARAALEALRARIVALKAEVEAVAAVAAEAAEQAAAASQVAEQGEATLRELEQGVEAQGPADDHVQRALETVRTAVTNARFSAATAATAADRARSARTRADAEAASEEANTALEDALDALERVVEAEQMFRRTVEDRKHARVEAARRAEDDRRSSAEHEARTRAAAEEQERRLREEHRKANVERRAKERSTSGAIPAPAGQASGQGPAMRATAASDRDSLRAMLRRSRPGTSDGGAEAERPRRRADPEPQGPAPARPTAAEPAKAPGRAGPTTASSTTATRSVRTWTPSQSATASRASAPATGTLPPTTTIAGATRPQRPVAERPSPERPSPDRPSPERPSPDRPSPPAARRPVPSAPPPARAPAPVPQDDEDDGDPETQPDGAAVARRPLPTREASRPPSAPPPPPASPRGGAGPAPATSRPSTSSMVSSSDSPKVDELLQRLRARRSEKD